MLSTHPRWKCVVGRVFGSGCSPSWCFRFLAQQMLLVGQCVTLIRPSSLAGDTLVVLLASGRVTDPAAQRPPPARAMSELCLKRKVRGPLLGFFWLSPCPGLAGKRLTQVACKGRKVSDVGSSAHGARLIVFNLSREGAMCSLPSVCLGMRKCVLLAPLYASVRTTLNR